MTRIKDFVRNCGALLRARDDGQDMVEYALVAGGVAIAVVLGLYGLQFAVEMVLGLVCPSVDTAAGIGATAGSCIQ
jgi:Flp pilus assembly pilin Flp